MRQRKAKDLEQRLRQCSTHMVGCGRNGQPEPEQVAKRVSALPEELSWQDIFGRDADLYVEIGCGKGSFILQKAQQDPGDNFVAVEGQETVILRAVEKIGQGSFPNLRFLLAFIDRMDDFFQQDQLSGIYLNFSDPWPKARHAKRRLTYRDRLRDYQEHLKPGGFIEIKTDNDSLFDFTLEEIAQVGMEITEMTRDLHAGNYTAKEIMTEYEAKFSNAGKNINYVKVVK